MQAKLSRLPDVTSEEKNLIRNFDSLLKVGRLVYVTSHWWLRILCIFWVSHSIIE